MINKKRKMYAVGLGLDLDKPEDQMLKNGLDVLIKQENRTISYFVREGLILLMSNYKKLRVKDNE